MVCTGLKDRVALITAANNPPGIGAAVALALAREGANVFLTYLRLSPEKWGVPADQADRASEPGLPLYHAVRMRNADEVLDAVRAVGATASVWETDLTDGRNVPALFDYAEAEVGPVEILVNNAAHYSNTGAIGGLTPEVIDDTYAVNTRAPLLLIDEFVRRHAARKATWGRIVNLGTGPAQCFETQISYGSSKAAIEAATRAVADRVGRMGITVNAIAPGITQTGYVSSRRRDEWLPTIPMGRLGTPEDIANTIVLLASDQAGWTTG
jgi:3-oxoacyl-[acyl-carrier protein] reductase